MNSGWRWVTPESIMSASSFKQGFIDARAEMGFRQSYERMDPDLQWNYERGRMFALLAPNFVLGRVVSREALEAFDAVSGLIP